MVEYILVLIVATILILTFIWLFSTSFQAWANNYFGDYLTCLLETGELPSLGGTPGDSGLCNQYFEPFSIKAGRELKPVTANSTGNSQPTRNPALATGEGRRGRVQGSGGGGGGGGGSGSTGGRGNGQLGSDEGEKGGETKKGDHGDSFLNVGGGSNEGSRNGGDRGRFVDGNIIGGIKKDENKSRSYTSNTRRSEDGLRTKKFFR